MWTDVQAARGTIISLASGWRKKLPLISMACAFRFLATWRSVSSSSRAGGHVHGGAAERLSICTFTFSGSRARALNHGHLGFEHSVT